MIQFVEQAPSPRGLFFALASRKSRVTMQVGGTLKLERGLMAVKPGELQCLI
jgi:hypothetical protein